MANRDSELRRLGKTLIQVLFWLCLGGTLAYANADWHKQPPIPGPGNQVVATAVTPDATHAATVTDDGHISLWDLNLRKLIRSKHLPQGTPHRLAIRNQADAIAVAYEDADAVIWWCDGSNKLVLPDVRARLVAFAHKKKILAVGQWDGWGSSWKIEDGALVNQVDIQLGRIDGPFLAVLPKDDGAITFNNGILGANGFMLEIDASINAGGMGFISNASQEPELIHNGDHVEVHYLDSSGVTLSAYEVSKGSTRLPYANHFYLAATSKGNTNGSIGLNPWYSVAVATIGPGQATVIVAGNSSGDLIIYRRTQSNDWLYHPTAWLLVIFGAAFIAQIIKISRNKKPHPNPEDALLPLPTSTRIAAYMIAVLGGLMIVGMIAGLFFGGFNLNLMLLLLPAGIFMLKRKSNGWRKCGVFFIWAVLVVGGITLGTSLLAGQPLEFELGRTQHFAPVWVGVAMGTIITLIGVFGWHALTDPRAKRICAAASYASQYSLLEMRRNALMACPDCGYDTRQTVRDGFFECPECGRPIGYTDEDRAWISRRVDDWRKPLDARD